MNSFEKKRCESCGTIGFERWEGDSGLTGTRCSNKCLISYKINMEREDEKEY